MLERTPPQFRELHEITMQTDTRDILAHATRQAESHEDYFLVDIDAHVTETSFWPEILAMIDNDVIRQMGEAVAGRPGSGNIALLNNSAGHPVSARLRPHPAPAGAAGEGREEGTHHFVELARRSMDALGLDYQVVFPTPMLTLGMHPQDDIEVALGAAYNKWLVETILPRGRSPQGHDLSAVQHARSLRRGGQEVRPRRQHHRLFRRFDAQQAGASQQLHEALCDDGGDRQAVLVPLRLQLERSVVPAAQPLHLDARAELRALQPDPHDQLDHQRAARAFPEAEGALDRERARLDSLPDAAARPRIPDAVLRGADAEAAAERVHVATCSIRASRWRRPTSSC